MKKTEKKIEEYYDQSTKFYLTFFVDRDSLGMHYGYWENGIRTQKEAGLNLDRKVAELLQIQAGDRVLDAGCGVGGTSIWMAENFGGTYDGITISDVQVDMANRFVRQRGLSDRIHFHNMDYRRVNFPDGTFDKAFAIESFCHCYNDLLATLKEMYRLLKAGGRIVLCDGFLHHAPRNDREKKWLQDISRGWHLDPLPTKDDIVSIFKKAGFRNVLFTDRTSLVQKTAQKLYRIIYYCYPMTKLLQLFRLVTHVVPDNVYAVMAQKKMLASGFMGHGTFSAEK